MWWLRKRILPRLRYLCWDRPRTWPGRTRPEDPFRTTPSGLPSSRETCLESAGRRSAPGRGRSRWRGRRCGRRDVCGSSQRRAAVRRMRKTREAAVCASLSIGPARTGWSIGRLGRRWAMGCRSAHPWPRPSMWWWPCRRHRPGRMVIVRRAWHWKQIKNWNQTVLMQMFF